MEVLKPIYAAVALIGLHQTRTFHVMIIDSETNYTTLLDVFKQLYIELDTVEPENLITKEHVLNFQPIRNLKHLYQKNAWWTKS